MGVKHVKVEGPDWSKVRQRFFKIVHVCRILIRGHWDILAQQQIINCKKSPPFYQRQMEGVVTFIDYRGCSCKN